MNNLADKARRPLVIGVGNAMGGDDAAGRLVAQKLAGAKRDFDVMESFGGAADLVTAFEGRAHVLIVDACLSGAGPGTLHHFDACAAALPPFLNAVSSHAIGVGEGIELARALDMLPDICQVIAIEGGDFTTGAPVSKPVADAVQTCAFDILSRLGRASR